MIAPARCALAAAAALALSGLTAGTATATGVDVVGSYTCVTSTGRTVPVGVHFGGGLPDDVGPNGVSYAQPALVDLDLDITSLVSGRVDDDSTAVVEAWTTGPDKKQTQGHLRFAATRDTPWLHAAGGLDALYLNPAGTYRIHLGAVSMSLRPKAADGSALPAVDARCTPSTGDSLVLGSLQSFGLIADRPLRPYSLAVVSATATTATLTWEANRWWNPTAYYEVYVNDTVVAKPVDKQVVLTGLVPDGQYRVKVVTRDTTGSASLKSAGLVFSTSPA
ncbi:fibronectin type III domain-containing protein [Lentzea sp. NPDC060358]|uniref:fibronectin type III domain-containing protein n=1 Tax=Lentzea sp. NPDC060358 TaxID=3347103 RepID=UPI00364CC70E